MTQNRKMSSRERVLTTFTREEPDYVPAWLGAAPETRELLIERLGLADDEALSEYLGDDFRRVYAKYAGPDEFSPDANLMNVFYKMYDEPELIDALLEKIVDHYFGVSQRIFDAAADVMDIFFIGNDFGGQTGPLMSEKMFRRFFLPHLKRLVDLGHDYGLKVMMHCCGGYAPLIPSLIEIGLDGLQALQPFAKGMAPAELKAAFSGKMVFNGCIDTQSVLIEGTLDPVKTKTREVLEIMMPGGGYIASPSHDYLLPETPVENIIAMYDTVREYGHYAS